MRAKYFALIFISIAVTFAVAGSVSASERTRPNHMVKTAITLPAATIQFAQERVRVARERANQRMMTIQNRVTQRLAKKRLTIAIITQATATSTADFSATSTDQ